VYKQQHFSLLLRIWIVGGVFFILSSVGTFLFTTIRSDTDIRTADIAAYWTPQRMRSTLSAPARQLTSSSFKTSTTIANTFTSVNNLAIAAPHATPVTTLSDAPESVVGTLFFTHPFTKQDHACSGTVIKSDNKSLISTAAHCLYARGAPVINIAFCPRYHDGPSSYGCWTGFRMVADARYLAGDPSADSGFLVVAQKKGQTIQDAVGSIGALTNYAAQSVTAYGYPARPPFPSGTRMYSVTETSQPFTYTSKDGSITYTMNHMVNNDMNQGSSGGPWVVSPFPNTFYIVGLNSIYMTKFDALNVLDNLGMLSPIFDQTWSTMYTQAQSIVVNVTT
jgi:hypothetical protein